MSAVEPDRSGEHALKDLLATLEPGQRQAFVLTQLLGFPYEDAAQICGCPIGTIRSRVARTRAQLAVQTTAIERRA